MSVNRDVQHSPAQSDRGNTGTSGDATTAEAKSFQDHYIEQFQDVVKVLVGKDEVAFTVNSKVLVQSSPFFRAALNSHWVESKERIVRLPEDQPFEFAIFVDWSYTGRLLAVQAVTEKQEAPTSSLVRLYVLSDKLQTPGLKDLIIETLMEKVDSLTFTAEDCEFAINNLRWNSGLLVFMIDWWIIYADCNAMDSSVVARIPKMVAAVAQGLMNGDVKLRRSVSYYQRGGRWTNKYLDRHQKDST